jgi:beta-xylosidase
MTQTDDPKTGAWSEPVLILPGKGIIDPTPLWDDDGQAWLLHAWAKSRSGKNNILTLHRMSPDGIKVEEPGKVIIDGNKLPGYRTLEGPKFYKRNGYYYVFAPAGGVPVGWQAVFRSKTIDGPYEVRTVMEQGSTLVNGPHQGAWVQTQTGEDWFFHFQSNLAYGRIVHLQPMQWVDDWPVIGSDADGDGVGNLELHEPGYPTRALPRSHATSESSLMFNLDKPGHGLHLRYQGTLYDHKFRPGFSDQLGWGCVFRGPLNSFSILLNALIYTEYTSHQIAGVYP